MGIQFKKKAVRFWIIVSSLISLLSSTDAAQAEKRVAFVVGNGAYKNVAQLSGPPIDAVAMATTLRNVGFDLVEGTNLTGDKMTERLLEFGKKAQGADVALFFYAGHGITIEGANYLLPIDADIKSELDVKLGSAIDVDVTLEQTMGDAKVKLMFLDACRDNPFAAKIRLATATHILKTGLAGMKSGGGTLIAFAAGPGVIAPDDETGTNSPFTRALVANITTPGVEINQAMTKVRAQVYEETNKGQLPWVHTTLLESVFLNPIAAPPGTTAEAPNTAAMPADRTSEVELEFWRSVRETNKPEGFEAYLLKYPNGRFKSLALAEIASMYDFSPRSIPHRSPDSDEPLFRDEADQATEDQIGLDNNQRRDVQRGLTALGFDAEITGRFDNDIRSVIRRWQSARGYPISGYLNKLQHKALISEVAATKTMPGSADDEPRRARRSKGEARQHNRGIGIGLLFDGIMRPSSGR